MDRPNPEQVRDLLLKQWMTHDAMWFKYTMEEVGMAEANRINRLAVRAMARVEAKRLTRLLGLAGVRCMADLRAFVEGASQAAVGEWMGFSHRFTAPDTLRCDMTTCFAHQGMQRLGAIDHYQCGIFERIQGWLEELGVTYEVEPKVEGCMMHSQGHCHRLYRVTGFRE